MTAARRTEIRIAQLKRSRDLYKEFFEFDHGEESAIRASYPDKSPLVDAFVAYRHAVAVCPLFLFSGDYQAQALLKLAADLRPHADEFHRADWILVGMNTRIEKWMNGWHCMVPVQFVEVRNALKVFMDQLDEAGKKKEGK